MENIESRHSSLGGARDSSIELFRIVSMFVIVAHHYVVSSGVLEEIVPENVLSVNSIFALLFGWGGKTGINCFVLITGYFMCKSQISLKKFLKLLLQMGFYGLLFSFIFWLSGYSVKGFIKTILPIWNIGTGFTGSYLVFYLFIPYLNLLIHAMEEKQHFLLIGLSLFVGSILQTFFRISPAFTYVGWFMVLYLIAAYVRIYPKKIFDSRKIWGFLSLVTLLLSWLSVVFGSYVYARSNEKMYYYFVADTHKLLAAATGICAFMFFKNLNIKYHPFINKVAASTFGVLLIHANSDTMRQWLWRDTLQNVVAFYGDHFVLHAVGSVLLVYSICSIIDMIRIRFLEVPFFKWYVKKMNAN